MCKIIPPVSSGFTVWATLLLTPLSATATTYIRNLSGITLTNCFVTLSNFAGELKTSSLMNFPQTLPFEHGWEIDDSNLANPSLFNFIQIRCADDWGVERKVTIPRGHALFHFSDSIYYPGIDQNSMFSLQTTSVGLCIDNEIHVYYAVKRQNIYFRSDNFLAF